MKRYIYLLFFFIVSLVSYVYATTSVIPDGFVVDVSPSTFAVNEAVDVTIKAIKTNGDVIKDYNGIVMVELVPAAGSSLWFDEVTLPGEWIVFFEVSDLWEKRLSKSLIIKKNGVYTLKVSDIDNEQSKGQKDIVVWQQEHSVASSISFVTPTSGSVETVSAVTVLANAPELPNSPYHIFVDSLPVSTGFSSAQWSINAIITRLQEWSHTLQIKIIDATQVVLWQSPVITFRYQSPTDDLFKGIQIFPSTQIKQWDKVAFTVSTSDTISSVELLLGSGGVYPMDSSSTATYVKEVLMENKWNIPVSLRLHTADSTKLYQNVANLSVAQSVSIGLIKFYTDSIDKSSLSMMWQVIWQASGFTITYGTNKNNLDQTKTLSTNEIKISNIKANSLYYFQITPVDHQGNVIGVPSDIKEIDPSLLQAQVTCIVDGIVLRTGQIDNSYYLIRDPIQHAQKYFIYRSDALTSIVSEMKKIGETTEARFAYPFDSKTMKDTFAYYAVQAVCADGKEILINEVKKVQVWPYDTLLLAIVFSLFVYSILRLYRRIT